MSTVHENWGPFWILEHAVWIDAATAWYGWSVQFRQGGLYPALTKAAEHGHYPHDGAFSDPADMRSAEGGRARQPVVRLYTKEHARIHDEAVSSVCGTPWQEQTKECSYVR